MVLGRLVSIFCVAKRVEGEVGSGGEISLNFIGGLF